MRKKQNAFKSAVKKVNDKKLSRCKTSEHYGIPEKTLRRYLSKNIDTNNMISKLLLGAELTLGYEAERKLAKRI